MEPLSAIIVDDELSAREGLSERLAARDSFSVVAVCENGDEALASIEQSSPDVLFVDIELPGFSGIELVEALSFRPAPLPFVVFVTAVKEFAAKAFECQAFDYLLKPYSDARLERCLDKLYLAHEQQRALRQQQQLNALLSRKTGKTLEGFIHSLTQSCNLEASHVNDTIAMKNGTEWLRVKVDDIAWLESAGDYVCVHTETDNHIIRTTLKNLHKELCPQRFLRLNRSMVVNSSKVKKLTPNSNGEYTAELDNGVQIKVSRRYKLALQELG